MSSPARAQQAAPTATGSPTAQVTVGADGTGRVVIDGGAPTVLTGGSVDDARRQVREVIAGAAAALGRPVQVHTSDPDGQWHLLINPDGTLIPLEQGPPTQSAPAHTEHPQPTGNHVVQPPADVPSSPGAPSGPGASSGAVGPSRPVPLPTSRPAAVVRSADEHLVAVHAQAPLAQQTLADLLAARPQARVSRATWGWQAVATRVTGGLLHPQPSPAELAHRAGVAAVQRSLSGPKTVVVVNPKGGAHKTTSALLIAQAFGTHRGGYTLAWDANETRGTLGWRAEQTRNHLTAVDLLRDLDRFTGPHGRVGDLDNYVRAQGSARFDVLASNEDPALAASIGAAEFRALHEVLTRFYRVLVVDTGNNMLAPNWRAAVEAADQLVIVSSVREDTGQSAAWLADGLVSAGLGHKVAEAVTVLCAPARRTDRELHTRLRNHFTTRTRRVLDVPHDAALVAGGPIAYDQLTRATTEAWLQVTAAIADGL
jgi:MinD-like ATPase involved in chromosome partitioning or flagellar assembly